MTKIMVISDLCRGGAATSCRRLVRGLSFNADFNVQWFTTEKDMYGLAGNVADWGSLVGLIAYRFTRRFTGDSEISERCFMSLSEKNILRAIRRQKPDIINIHNIHQKMAFSLLEQIPDNVLIVWTLHDMWPLTGYCCYSYECQKYLDGCRGGCLQEKKWRLSWNSPANEWLRRNTYFSNNANRIVIVAPSRWLFGLAGQRLGSGISIKHIPYGLDLNVFRPVDKISARKVLGLSVDSKIILYGVDALLDPRKGYIELNEAHIRLVKKYGQSLLVVLFGTKCGICNLENHIYAGRIYDDALLSLYYNAADVYVLPSLADNLPNTLLESISSGTPCVTFDIGGCSEVVRNGETGFVAKYKDVNSLAECIDRVLCMKDDERDAMRKKCREVAESEYGLNLQAERYIKLFEEITNR